MSYNELLGWQKYFEEEPSNSIEIQLALLSQMVSSFGGGKHTLKDFLITQYNGETKEEEPTFATEESVKAIFSLMSSKTSN